MSEKRRFKVTFMPYEHVSPELSIKCGEFSMTLDAFTKAGAELQATAFMKDAGHRSVIPKSVEEVAR